MAPGAPPVRRMTETAAMLGTTILRVILYTLSLLVLYGLGILWVFVFVASPNLIDMVSSCKIVSLLILIYANREIPHAIEIDKHSDVQNLNLAIISVSSLILILMIIKTIVQDYSLVGFPPTGHAIISYFSGNSYWISTVPVFAYFLLDVYIAVFRRSPPEDRRIATEFIIFRDLVCALPLAMVLLLTELYLFMSPYPDAEQNAQLFFSGAIAVILLSSAISSKALDLMQSRRRAVVAEAAGGRRPSLMVAE
jgi:hypothetical protein